MWLGFFLTTHRPHAPSRPVALWLFLCCGLLLTTVALGGVTRLTQAGLSIVEWKPFSIFPPIGEKEWQDAFLHYQKFPEYRLKTVGMTLKDFQGIFWLEYIHRLAGRLIGVIFLVPFLWFLIRQRIDHRLGWKLAGLFLLGSTQGIIGWLMVQSGLAEQPDVSQYHLTAHLGLALLIYGLLLWIALGVLQPRHSFQMAPLAMRLWSVLGLLVITLLSGGLVAGLDAGFTHNTFPLMNGKIVPEDLFVIKPWYLNLFENVVMVQFQHRLLAITTLGAVILLLWGKMWCNLSRYTRILLVLFIVITGIQCGLGILTLLFVIPMPLAVAHQVGAFILFSIGLLILHLLHT